MQRWSMKTYLERALKAYQEENPGKGLPIAVSAWSSDEIAEIELVEVHSDFIITQFKNHRTLWPLGQIVVMIEESLIGAGKKTKSGGPLEKPKRAKSRASKKETTSAELDAAFRSLGFGLGSANRG